MILQGITGSCYKVFTKVLLKFYKDSTSPELRGAYWHIPAKAGMAGMGSRRVVHTSLLTETRVSVRTFIKVAKLSPKCLCKRLSDAVLEPASVELYVSVSRLRSQKGSLC